MNLKAKDYGLYQGYDSDHLVKVVDESTGSLYNSEQ